MYLCDGCYILTTLGHVLIHNTYTPTHMRNLHVHVSVHEYTRCYPGYIHKYIVYTMWYSCTWVRGSVCFTHVIPCYILRMKMYMYMYIHVHCKWHHIIFAEQSSCADLVWKWCRVQWCGCHAPSSDHWPSFNSSAHPLTEGVNMMERSLTDLPLPPSPPSSIHV